MIILDGKKIASKIIKNIEKACSILKDSYSFTPCLLVIIVGSNPASQIYVRNKRIMAEKAGFKSIELKLGENTSEKELLNIIDKYNKTIEVDGILVQLPLPKHINTLNIIDKISPIKDVDGFHPYNSGLLSSGNPTVVPCTPQGCLILIKEYYKDLKGKNAVVIGRSNIVGRPMFNLLIKEDATVTLIHSKTNSIPDICRRADIVIAALGKPEIVKASWLKKDSLVIDVGINYKINKLGEKKLVGDVDFDDVKGKVAAISPVPGGVGPMTIACLLSNTLNLAILKRDIKEKFKIF